jgi:diadenosine tetraphosphatase ApaH/serine/threonine PP2A family protein phosphatase
MKLNNLLINVTAILILMFFIIINKSVGQIAENKSFGTNAGGQPVGDVSLARSHTQTDANAFNKWFRSLPQANTNGVQKWWDSLPQAVRDAYVKASESSTHISCKFNFAAKLLPAIDQLKRNINDSTNVQTVLTFCLYSLEKVNSFEKELNEGLDIKVWNGRGVASVPNSRGNEVLTVRVGADTTNLILQDLSATSLAAKKLLYHVTFFADGKIKIIENRDSNEGMELNPDGGILHYWNSTSNKLDMWWGEDGKIL